MAVAKYLRYIYTTEAQASGLLVMASYNWGENRVRKLIRKMPKNPRQRNFWDLIKKHNIPKETYNYVYYIFSAAVIGEDPQRLCRTADRLASFQSATLCEARDFAEGLGWFGYTYPRVHRSRMRWAVARVQPGE
jgi:hypothetical protein